MTFNYAVFLVPGWLFCAFLAFGIAKYWFTEQFHFHNPLSDESDNYRKAFTANDHLIFGFCALAFSPVALLVWLYLAKYLRAETSSSHRFGIALTKNIRFPNHHRPS